MNLYSQHEMNKLVREDRLHILGRTSKEHPFSFFWTASGLSMQVKATEMWVTIESAYGSMELWVDFLIDDAPSQRIILQKGTNHLCVFRGLDSSTSRKISILRDTQAMPDDSVSILSIRSLETDGEFQVLEQPRARIEFIGDSLTSGEGGAGAVGEMEWKPFVFNPINNYAYMLSQDLQAEYHVLSQSGWGAYCSWDGIESHSLPPYYDKVCGVLSGPSNEAEGTQESWDFSSWQPDTIVVNLGTNDYNPILSGARDREDVTQAFIPTAVHFLHTLRLHNPSAYIIWAYGMCGNGFQEPIENALELYRKESGDTRVRFVLLPDTKAGEFGSRQHPGTLAHQHAAQTLFQVISSFQ